MDYLEYEFDPEKTSYMKIAKNSYIYKQQETFVEFGDLTYKLDIERFYSLGNDRRTSKENFKMFRVLGCSVIIEGKDCQYHGSTTWINGFIQKPEYVELSCLNSIKVVGLSSKQWHDYNDLDYGNSITIKATGPKHKITVTRHVEFVPLGEFSKLYEPFKDSVLALSNYKTFSYFDIINKIIQKL